MCVSESSFLIYNSNLDKNEKWYQLYFILLSLSSRFRAAILDSPNMLIAEDEKIICEITKDNETVIEER